jgi:hypothetical protein
MIQGVAVAEAIVDNRKMGVEEGEPVDIEVFGVIRGGGFIVVEDLGF